MQSLDNSMNVFFLIKALIFVYKPPIFFLQVVDCLIKLIGPNGGEICDNASIFLACDTVMNLLLKVVYYITDSQISVNFVVVSRRYC